MKGRQKELKKEWTTTPESQSHGVKTIFKITISTGSNK